MSISSLLVATIEQFLDDVIVRETLTPSSTYVWLRSNVVFRSTGRNR